MNQSSKIMFLSALCTVALFISGCQSAMDKQLAQKLDQIEQKLEKIEQLLPKQKQTAAPKQTVAAKSVKPAQTAAKTVAKPQIPASAKAAPQVKPQAKVQVAVKAAPVQKTEPKAVAKPQTVKPAPVQQAAAKPAEAAPKAASAEVAAALPANAVEIGRFDAKNLNSIGKKSNISELTVESDIVKIASKGYGYLGLGRFEGEEYLVRVTFAYCKDKISTLSVSIPPFNKVHRLTLSDNEKVFDTIAKCNKGNNNVGIYLHGTQYLKSVVVYRLK